jgi:hypothetical protein
MIVGSNVSSAKNKYNPEEVSYKSSFDKNYEKDRNKRISKIVEEHDGKVYVKQYSSFEDFKNYLIDEDDGAIFYDPEVSDKKISLLIVYRIDKFTDVFEAIFMDYESN